jgi:hypothetical protein
MKLSLLDVSAACRSRMECIEANTHDVQYENLSSLKATIDRIQSCVDGMKAWLEIGQQIKDGKEVTVAVEPSGGLELCSGVSPGSLDVREK